MSCLEQAQLIMKGYAQLLDRHAHWFVSNLIEQIEKRGLPPTKPQARRMHEIFTKWTSDNGPND